ncbi:phage portal protein [Neorhizobium petrolearium]|uniref:phage portal protein n=1 Tax=Neorhizobium petrolearium TaxID=515361 RepID=UPI003F16AA9F
MLRRVFNSFFARTAETSPQRRAFDALPDRRQGHARRWGDLSHVPEVAPAFARQRARQLVLTNAYAAAAVNAYVSNLVGYGITPASHHSEDAVRAAIANAWQRFSRIADIESRQNLSSLWASAVRAMVIDGESFIRILDTEEGIRLQILPAEQVDESMTVDLAGGGFIRSGIEFDAGGQRVAYHVLPVNPADPFQSYAAPIRVPAAEIVHLYEPLQPGMVRGLSWFAPVLLRLSELDKLEDANQMGVAVAAMHAGFLIDQNGNGSIPYDGTQAGGILESGLEPGTLKVLPAGYDVRFNAPQTATHGVSVAEHELRAIAAGLGVPQHVITGDLRQANYSSLRADMVRFRQRIEALQWNLIIPVMCQPVFDRVITSAVLRGEIDLANFWADPAPYLVSEWYPPKIPAVDPAKEATAIREMLAAGLMSRRQAVAELGFDIEQLDAEIAADRAREARLGLAFPVSTNSAQEASNAGS